MSQPNEPSVKRASAAAAAGGKSGNSWFAHLAVKQPFDVSSINGVIYGGVGVGWGRGAVKVGVTTTCFLLTDPLHLNICCQCVYFDGAESTLLFFTSSAGRHRVRYQPVCCTAGTPRCAALIEGISSVVSWSYSLAMCCSICPLYF